MAPATLGAAAVQVNVFVNNNFASYLGNGPVSWLNVAFRFMQLPIGLFGVAIGTVTLPLVSRHGARGDTRAFRTTVGQALELVALFCLPAAAGLALLGVPVIGLVYEHGRFAPRDTAAAAEALAGYALGLAGYAGIKVLAPAFYALNDARTPAGALPAGRTLHHALRLAGVIPVAVAAFWAACRALGVAVPGLRHLGRA